jgi:hypothetical protein
MKLTSIRNPSGGGKVWAWKHASGTTINTALSASGTGAYRRSIAEQESQSAKEECQRQGEQETLWRKWQKA